MKIAVCLLCIIALYMISAVILVPVNLQIIVFTSPIFIALLTLLVILILLESRKQGFSWRKLGFQLSHLGVVIVLTGALLGYAFAQDTFFYIPIGSQYFFDKLPKADNNQIELGFSFNIADFKVEHYDPDYALYKPVSNSDSKSGNTDYEYVKTVSILPGRLYDLGLFGKIQASNLKEEEGSNWVSEYVLDNDWKLIKLQTVDRFYLAEMNIFDGGVQKKNLSVNHPVNYQGWRFFLMSYDSEANNYVFLRARKDQGRYFVIIGIWLLIIGVGALGFRKQSNS